MAGLMLARGAVAADAISVSSSDLQADRPIPDAYSAYHQNISPSLAWFPVRGAKAYAVIVDDPDAPSPQPFVHWVAWNIPPEATGLPEGLNQRPGTVPHGMIEGTNGTGKTGYFGPRPPRGDPPHRYRFKVYALNEPLNIAPGTDKAGLLDAMEGHVLAEGELVATYQKR
ncbi:MAG: YbhB/YbcL family Raf kinase inhibitor-like protein [Alphaproteobacteria bacterium]|nr:YbhB/YbcL family Raf kinase inhibitor-like protein [Alphaproteobacteria bacterium]